MERVDFAEGGAHFAGLQLEADGEGGEGDIAFLEVDAVLAEAEEEVGAGVGVDDLLHADFALVHFEGGRVAVGRISGVADKIADHRDIWVERFGGRSAGAAELDRGRDGAEAGLVRRRRRRHW